MVRVNEAAIEVLADEYLDCITGGIKEVDEARHVVAYLETMADDECGV